ncbi:MAG: YajQ family cyclic di-GMP-binding protein [Legionellales bacterium]|nr:YajQ family cyclic di-GMP-binding protein [Legionellales bacterium]|tara:strand:- start:4040 stop:4522 length:483 start_codon:yes stop_codon:yes gene_type:complete
MPSFDIVSKVDKHELANAVDQANRELQNRFDFKGVDAKYTLTDKNIVLEAPSDFQLKQMKDILAGKFTKRELDVRSLTYQDPEVNLSQAKQAADIVQGLSQETAKKLVKTIKESKLKVQASIQGEQVRVTGKKRDDLQDVIAMLREADVEVPLQFENFRD